MSKDGTGSAKGLSFLDRWPSSVADLTEVEVIFAAERDEKYEWIEFATCVQDDNAGSGDSDRDTLSDDDDDDAYASEDEHLDFILRHLVTPEERALVVNLVFAGRGADCEFEDFLRLWLSLDTRFCIGVTRRRWNKLATTFKRFFPDYVFPAIVKIPGSVPAETFFDGLISNDSSSNFDIFDALSFELNVTDEYEDVYDDVESFERDEVMIVENDASSDAIENVADSFPVTYLANASFSPLYDSPPPPPALALSSAPISTSTAPNVVSSGTTVSRTDQLTIKVSAKALTAFFLPAALLLIVFLIVYKLGKY